MVMVVQIESVYLVVVGQKGTEGGSLNLKAFEMASYIKEDIHQQYVTSINKEKMVFVLIFKFSVVYFTC